MDLVVAYDIATAAPEGQRRLYEVAKLCESYGVRMQKSVFEARLSERQLEQFIGDVLDVIHPDEDSVVVYRVGGNIGDARLVLGRSAGQDFDSPWVL